MRYENILNDVVTGATIVTGRVIPTSGSCHSALSLKKGIEAGLPNVTFTVSNVMVTGSNNDNSLVIDPIKVYSFQKSQRDGVAITSRNLESLELSNSSAGYTETTFNLTYFNASDWTNKSTVIQNVNGTWFHLNSSINTLSCSLVRTDSLLGFLHFDGKNIALKGNFSIQSIMNLSYLNTSFPGKYHLGENCDVFKFES